MKITVFNGSPKGKRSNTHIVVQSFLEGAAAAGAEVENVFLSKHEIKHCRGCLHCWIKTPGKCIIKDDMAGLIEKFLASDIACLATPLYIDNISGMTKVFLDRLCAVVDPHFVMGADGETQHVKNPRRMPEIMVISTCGYPERSQFQVLELLFRRTERNMNSRLVAEIYRSQGNLLGIENEMLAPVVDAYKKLVVKAGRELVENGGFTDETIAALDKDLVPRDMYNDGANRYWDSQLAKLKKKENT